MPGIFDTLGAAMQSGSVGEGVSKITEALMAPGAATQSAIDKEKADMAAKGMVKTPAGNWITKPKVIDINNPTGIVLPSTNAMPPNPATVPPVKRPFTSGISNPAGYAMGVADRAEIGG
jgi:hypothetical protein